MISFVKNNTIEIALGVLSIILLCLMIFFPKGYDQAVFSVGSKMIIEQGAIPYRDFIDTKPPVIFYIYSLGHIISSDTDISYRIIDIIYQLITCALLFVLVKRIYINTMLASTAVFIYTILYVSSGYYMTAQAESFVALPGILLVLMMSKTNLSTSGIVFVYFIAGLILVYLFLLKFTFVFFAIGIVVFILLSTDMRARKKWVAVLTMGISFCLFLGIYLVYLFMNDGIEPLTNGIQWVSGYANLTPLFSYETIRKQYFLLFPQNLLHSYTPMFLLLLFYGVYISVRDSIVEKGSTQSKYIILSILLLVTGLLGVLYERKCMTYHYSRVYFLSSIFISLGLLEVFPILFNRLKKLLKIEMNIVSITRVALLLCLFAGVLFYSPLTRLVSHPIRWTYLWLDKDEQSKAIYLDLDKLHGTDKKQLYNSLKDYINVSGDIFFWGNFVEIYNVFGVSPVTACLTNTPFITKWSPKEWKDTLINKIKLSRPKVFVVETNDAHPEISGITHDSFASLRSWRELYDYLLLNYYERQQIGDFKVYIRRDLL